VPLLAASADLVNGDFGIADPNAAGFGWTIRGQGDVINGQAVLAEGGVRNSGFSQTFLVPEGATRLRFTVLRASFGENGPNPPDAFEMALLRAGTLAPIVGTAAGLTHTDALFNLQGDGRVFFAGGVTVSGVAESGGRLGPDGPVTVQVDLAGVPAATALTVFFDLLGFGAANSSVTIDGVGLTGEPPVVDAGVDRTVDEGSPFAAAGSFTDPDLGDTWTAAVDYGDGTGLQALALIGNTFQLGHVYADNGAYTVTVAVTDSDAQVGGDSLSVTVRNVAPTVEAGADRTAVEGQVVSLGSATFSDSGTLDTHTATVDWGDGTAAETVAVTETPFGPPGAAGGLTGTLAASHVYADDGAYTLTLTVADDDGGVASAGLVVTVLDAAPTLTDVSVTPEVDETGVVTLAVTFADPGTLDSFTLVVDWGESAPESFALASGARTAGVTHRYLDDDPTGTASDVYPIAVRLTDKDGGLATAAVATTVKNVAPTVEAGPETTVAEGATSNVVATFGDVGVRDTHTLLVDWGDGSVGETLASTADASGTLAVALAHAYADDGDYTLTVTVTDDDAGVGVDTRAIHVVNVAPAVEGGADSATLEGAPVTVTAVFTDAGAADTHTALIDWGDGTAGPAPVDAVTRTVTGGHVYADDGVFAVRVTVTDDDGGTGGDGLAVTVANVAPALTAVAATPSIVEGDVVTLAGAFTDAGRLDTHVVVVDWGEGAPETVALTAGARDFTLAHRYLDDDPTGSPSDAYRIRVAVRDDDGGEGTGEAATVVSNAAPVATLEAPPLAVRGLAVTLDGTFTDVGTRDTHRVAWDFGDGTAIPLHASTDDGALTPVHVFASSGTYTVVLTVTDDDGGTSVVTRTVVVQAVALLPDPCDPGTLALFVGGTPGDDKIRIVPAEPPGTHGDDCGDGRRTYGRDGERDDDDRGHEGAGAKGVEVRVNGVSLGVFAHAGRIIVDGRGGNDDIEVAGGVRNEVELRGGAGDDRLKAGAGAALLLGGDGDDALTGGLASDVIIGGAGKDRLVGGAGDDLLIAGRSIYDDAAAALCRIFHEWAADAAYDTRVARLTGGVGGVRLTADTVQDDGVSDELTGAAGRDWFFATVSGRACDHLTDRHADERLAALAPAAPAPNPCAPRVDCARDDAGDDGHGARDACRGSDHDGGGVRGERRGDDRPGRGDDRPGRGDDRPGRGGDECRPDGVNGDGPDVHRGETAGVRLCARTLPTIQWGERGGLGH
jgi:PKD repeat protein